LADHALWRELTPKEYLPIVAVRLRIGKKPQVVSELAVARLLLREELQRIEESAVGHHLVVEVIAGCTTCGSEAADHLAALNVVAGLDQEA
jgi:hypothetical protein